MILRDVSEWILRTVLFVCAIQAIVSMRRERRARSEFCRGYRMGVDHARVERFLSKDEEDLKRRLAELSREGREMR